MDHQRVANTRAIVSGNQPAAVAFSVAGEPRRGSGSPFLPEARFVRDSRGSSEGEAAAVGSFAFITGAESARMTSSSPVQEHFKTIAGVRNLQARCGLTPRWLRKLPVGRGEPRVEFLGIGPRS